MDADALVGAWQLRSFVIRFSDGRAPLLPFGEDARGQLVYSASGRMSAILTRASRPWQASTGLERANRAGDAEKIAAFDSYLSYGGRYSIEGDLISHHVEYALVPGIVGQRQVRRVVYNPATPNLLTLEYAIVAKSGVSRCYELKWVRL